MNYSEKMWAAINQSIDEDRIVHVECDDQEDNDGVIGELQGCAEMDGNVEQAVLGVWEFWGTSEDNGADWRVHVRIPDVDEADSDEDDSDED